MKITCWIELSPAEVPTVTVVSADAIVPAALLASAVYVVVVVGVTVSVPPVDERVLVLPSVPVTTTEVALVAVTVSVSELPWLIEGFCAEIVTVGFGAVVVTVIVVWADVLPLELVAVAVYVVVEVGATVIDPPLYGRVYEVPFDPVTWTEAALVSVTVSVSDCPDEMLLELAVIEMVGLEPVVTVIVVAAEAVAPEELVACAVYVVVDAGETVIFPPASGKLYVEPSEPVTLTVAALEALTVNVSELPGLIEVCAAVIDTVGFVLAVTVTVVWDVALPLELVAVAV